MKIFPWNQKYSLVFLELWTEYLLGSQIKNGIIPIEGMLMICLEFASVGDFDSHLNVTIVIIICVYRMSLKIILIA